MKSKLKIQENATEKGTKIKVFFKKLPEFRNLFIELIYQTPPWLLNTLLGSNIVLL